MVADGAEREAAEEWRSEWKGEKRDARLWRRDGE